VMVFASAVFAKIAFLFNGHFLGHRSDSDTGRSI
jgi:hypothetical protein